MSPLPSPLPSWEDPLFRERVRKAMAMSPEEKLMEVARLFQEECQAVRGQIRAESPELDDNGVEQELQRRLNLQRQIEEEGIYFPLSMMPDAEESAS